MESEEIKRRKKQLRKQAADYLRPYLAYEAENFVDLVTELACLELADRLSPQKKPVGRLLDFTGE